MLAVYIPMGYYTDLFIYRRRQAKKRSSSTRRRTTRDGGPHVHRRAGAGELLPRAAGDGGDRAVIVDPGEEAPTPARARSTSSASRSRRSCSRTRTSTTSARSRRSRRRPARRSTARARAPRARRHHELRAVAGLRPVRELRGRRTRVARRRAPELAGFDIDVLFTPGHSPGHVTYSIPRRAARSSPATCCSRARSAAPTCRAATSQTLLDSIASLLDALPDETTVYPGHMGITTLGAERAHEPVPAELARTAERWQREAPGPARHLRRAARRRPRAATAVEDAARARSSSGAGYGRIETPDLRGDRAVRARRRRVHRHRPEGDVHVRGRRRALADAAPRGHRAGLPRLPRARHAQAAAAGEALVPVDRSSATSAPQAGRYRQFWQVGAEAIGSDDPARRRRVDRCCWPTCSTRSACAGVRLRLVEPRHARDARAPTASELRAYLRAHEDELSEEVRARIDAQPAARVRRRPPGHAGGDGATRRCCSTASPPRTREHFDAVRALLDGAGVAYELDPTLVRGLDYYTRTVFEFTLRRARRAERRRRRRPLRRPDRAARRPADARRRLGGGLERILLAAGRAAERGSRVARPVRRAAPSPAARATAFRLARERAPRRARARSSSSPGAR